MTSVTKHVRLLSRIILPLLAAAMSFCLFSCASALPAGPSERDIPVDYAGIVHAGKTKTQVEFDYLEYLNVSWILHTFNWDKIELEPGQWDFKFYDEMVDMAEQAGIKHLGLLAYDNWFIHSGKKRKKYIPPDKIPLFLEYVRRTVSHYRGKIDAWCIWNEPNAGFWTGTDKEFYTLTRLTADAVREVDSEVILMGGAFNRGIFGLPKKYIRGLFESGSMNNVDAVAFHPYEMNPNRCARLFDKFKEIVDVYGFGDKIWITEVGYPTGGWYPTKIPEKKMSSYVIKTCTLLAIRENRALLWFQLFDPEIRQPSDSEDFFGLVRSKNNYTSKGAEAFRLCSLYISGTHYSAQEPRRENLPKSLAAYYFYGDDTNTLILWNNSPGSKKVRVTLPGTDHAMHNPDTGAVTAIQAEAGLKVGSMPVFITWKGNESRTVQLSGQ